MASKTTKLSNIINPEVMSDMIEAKITAQCKLTPYAHVNNDLQGVAGDSITVLLGITLVMLKTLMLKRHLIQIQKLKQQFLQQEAHHSQSNVQ